MKAFSQKEKILSVVDEWRKTYEDGRYGEDKLETLKELSKLNLKKASPKDISDIIGNESWISLTCNECFNYNSQGIIFGQDGEYAICLDCLKKAIKIVNKFAKDKLNEKEQSDVK